MTEIFLQQQIQIFVFLSIHQRTCLKYQFWDTDGWEKEMVSCRVFLLRNLSEIFRLDLINNPLNAEHYVGISPSVRMFLQHQDQSSNEPRTLVWNSCRFASLQHNMLCNKRCTLMWHVISRYCDLANITK